MIHLMMTKRQIGDTRETYDAYIKLFCSKTLIKNCFVAYILSFLVSVHSTIGLNLDDTIFIDIASSNHINIPLTSWYNDKKLQTT